jgi:hypothetical protein
MQRNAHRAFIHAKVSAHLRGASPFNRNGAHDGARPLRQARQSALNIMCVRGRRRLRGQDFGYLVNGNIAQSSPTHGVYKFVPHNRPKPWTERSGGVPGVPFQMNGQENLLNDIFKIAVTLAASPQHASRGPARQLRDLFEKFCVNCRISSKSQAHHIAQTILFARTDARLFKRVFVVAGHFVTGCSKFTFSRLFTARRSRNRL